jgi:hypothetical protein
MLCARIGVLIALLIGFAKDLNICPDRADDEMKARDLYFT